MIRRLASLSVALLVLSPGVSAAQTHDLAITKFKVGPKRVKLTDRRLARTGPVRLRVENLGSETVHVPDVETLMAAFEVTAERIDGEFACPDPLLAPAAKRGSTPPFSIAPGGQVTLRFEHTFHCAPEAGRAVDWVFAAAIDHAALDGGADENPQNDVCPRNVGFDDGCGVRVAPTARVGPRIAVVEKRPAAALAVAGPFEVGTSDLVLVDASRTTMANGTFPGAPDRTLPLRVWYPALFSDIDAPLVGTGAPYPLIVFAHGLGSPNNASARLLAHLTSHGYVVVAPAFPLSHFGAPGGPTTADQPDQALDVAFVIDTFLGFSSDPGNFFAGAIDATRIGMTGHSNGGTTTLVTTYDALLRDPRIKAAMPMSPPGCLFQPGWYGAVDTPLLVLHGDNDLVVDFDAHALPIFARANAPKSLVRVANGNHLGFSDVANNLDDGFACEFLPDVATLEAQSLALIDALGGEAAFVGADGCALEICMGDTAAMEGERQIQISHHVGLAFFEANLRDNALARRFLEQEFDSFYPDADHTFE